MNRLTFCLLIGIGLLAFSGTISAGEQITWEDISSCLSHKANNVVEWRGVEKAGRFTRVSSRAAQTARDLAVAPRVTQAVSTPDPKTTLHPLRKPNRFRDILALSSVTSDYLLSNIPYDCEVPRRLRGSG